MDSFRIQRLKKQIGLPCLIEHPADLLYLTGLELSKGRLLVSSHEATLFVDGRYYERAKKAAPCQVKLWDEQKELNLKKMGFDSAAVSYEGYLSLQKYFKGVELIACPSPLKQQRVIKEENEITALKKAADLTKRGIEHVRHLFKEGITEEELAFEFEFFCRKAGASHLSFDSIIAFGENSAYPHYRAGKAKLKKGDVVLVDVGAVIDNYHGDMTRIFYFGDPDPKVVRLEKLVREAQNKAIAQIKPGVILGTLDQIVQDEFDRANVKPLYTHSLGHGVGLETHEFPRIRFDGEDKDVVIEAGMVFTIEPGLYQPGVGGIRIEDMILVTKEGHVRL
jgi:Xaa-Pro aminopeptidase